MELVVERIKEDPTYEQSPAGDLKMLVEQLLEGYADLLVTGEFDALDRLYRALSRVVAVRGTKFSGVFELPLVMEEVIRQQLVEEYKDETDGLQTFNEALDKTEACSRKTACRFLDVFQQDLDRRIENHNNYLARTQKELGIDLSRFKIASE